MGKSHLDRNPTVLPHSHMVGKFSAGNIKKSTPTHLHNAFSSPDKRDDLLLPPVSTHGTCYMPKPPTSRRLPNPALPKQPGSTKKQTKVSSPLQHRPVGMVVRSKKRMTMKPVIPSGALKAPHSSPPVPSVKPTMSNKVVNWREEQDNYNQFKSFMAFKAKQSTNRVRKRARTETILPSQYGIDDQDEEFDSDSADTEDGKEDGNDKNTAISRRPTIKVPAPKRNKIVRSSEILSELDKQHTTLSQFGLQQMLTCYGADNGKPHSILPVQTVKYFTQGKYNLGRQLRAFIAFHAQNHLLHTVKRLRDAIEVNGKRTETRDILCSPSGYTGSFCEEDMNSTFHEVLKEFRDNGVPLPAPFSDVPMDISARKEIWSELTATGLKGIIASPIIPLIAISSFTLAMREAVYFRKTTRETTTLRAAGTYLLECWLQKYDMSSYIAREALREVAAMINGHQTDTVIQEVCAAFIGDGNWIKDDISKYPDQTVKEIAHMINKTAPNVVKAATQRARFRQFTGAVRNQEVISALVYSGEQAMPCQAAFCHFAGIRVMREESSYIPDRLSQLSKYWQQTPEAHTFADHNQKKNMFGKPRVITHPNGSVRVKVPPSVLAAHHRQIDAELADPDIVQTALKGHIARVRGDAFVKQLMRALAKGYTEEKGLIGTLPSDVLAAHTAFVKKIVASNAVPEPFVSMSLGSMRLMNYTHCANIVANTNILGEKLFGEAAKLSDERLLAFLQKKKPPTYKNSSATSAAAQLATIYHMFVETVSSQSDEESDALSSTAEYFAVVWLSTLYTLATKGGFIGPDGLVTAEAVPVDKASRNTPYPLLTYDVAPFVHKFYETSG